MSLPTQDLPRDVPREGERYEFGPFRLDPAERLLSRGGQPVALTPKAFDLLAYLVERAGRLVEKRDLMAALWPDTVVEEANLAYTVSAVRKVLGDGQEGEQYIQTVPTRGYRFVAAVDARTRDQTAPAASRLRVLALAVAGSLILGAIAGGALVWRRRPSSATRTSVTQFELPDAVEVRDVAFPAVSPDGRRVVFAGRSGDKRQLFVRSLDTLEVTALPGTSGGRADFSPDGRSIAYCDPKGDPAGPGFTILVLATGATSRLAAPGCMLPTGGVWGRDGALYFARVPPQGLARVALSGGAPQGITTVRAGEMAHGFPDVLPDGRHLLFTVWHGEGPDEADARVLSLATGEVKTVLRDAPRAWFVATGHLVFAKGTSLFAVPFDPVSLEARGDPVRVMDGIARSPGGAPLFQVSSGGTLAYHRGGFLSTNTTEFAWFDISPSRVERVPAPVGRYFDPVLSPDDRKLAVAPLYIAENYGRHQDIWVHDFGRHTWTRVTNSPWFNAAPVWHPLDPERLIYTTTRPGRPGRDLVTIRADGSDLPEVLFESERDKYVGSSAPAAGLIAFTELTRGGDFDIWLMDLHGQPTARPFLQTAFNETTPALSPDGRWMAYDSNESGASEVYVRPLSGQGKWQLSNAGGERPRWSRDGRTIVYRRVWREGEPAGPDRMMAVAVSTEPSFVAATPRVVAEGAFAPGGIATANYDLSADGRRLLLITRSPETSRVPLVIVENWAEELRQKVGH
jgi:eukaryotic-like serine/threonine-protein kinase